MKDKLGWIYFIEMLWDEPELVKVGFASNVHERLSNLRTACPFELEILTAFRGTKNDERRLQEELAEHRFHLEWFHLNDSVRDLLDDIWDYQWDVAASGPYGKIEGIGERALQIAKEVPITGFWDWRNKVKTQSAAI